MNSIKDKKIGILGIGDENIALVNYMVTKGLKVTICDEKSRRELPTALHRLPNSQVDYRVGKDYLDNLKDFDIVFRTPGLPYLNEKIQNAKKEGVEISSAIKYFFEHCPSPILGVTGTKGKGTTSTLITEILKNNIREHRGHANRKVYFGGNIGTSPISFLDKLTLSDIVVLELSSFQLQDLHISPHIAVVLDIKVDHLDHHKNEAEYVTAKANILRYQKKSDICVVNADYLTSLEMALQSDGEAYWFSRRKSVDQGAYVLNGEIILRIHGKEHPIAKTSEVMLRGEHNLENICAAVTASYLAGADLESIKEIVKTFPGLEHRLEYFANIKGVKYYNDSFSTTPDTAIAAIKSFSEPVILIAGGSEKNADYKELGKVIGNSTVKTAILIGKTGPKIKKTIKKKIKIISSCKNLKEVISNIKKEVKVGDVVLLSPASASFDWFKNYKDRGNKFKELVK